MDEIFGILSIDIGRGVDQMQRYPTAYMNNTNGDGKNYKKITLNTVSWNVLGLLSSQGIQS